MTGRCARNEAEGLASLRGQRRGPKAPEEHECTRCRHNGRAHEAPLAVPSPGRRAPPGVRL